MTFSLPLFCISALRWFSGGIYAMQSGLAWFNVSASPDPAEHQRWFDPALPDTGDKSLRHLQRQMGVLVDASESGGRQ